MSGLERVTRGVASAVGEGPLWWAARAQLVWVDLHGDCILVTDVADGSTRRVAADRAITALAPAGERFVLATEHGVGWWDPVDDAVTPWLDLLDADHRMNDARCDAAGRLWAGSFPRAVDGPTGVMYRVAADGSVDEMTHGLGISNGLDWSPDGTRFYLADSPTRRIQVFDHDPATGRLGNARAFAVFGDGEGLPDGLCVDADGDVWVAMWEGSCVRRLAPDGRERERIDVPVGRTTSCAFGGPGLRDLYVTTAAYDAPEAERETAGEVFVLPDAGAGRPPASFAVPAGAAA